MSQVTAEDVKALRQRTGAGFMDCKKALQESEGDRELAIEWLRKKGLSSAAKKATRAATEGVVTSYIHHNNRVGVLLEVNTETDFVARNEVFLEFTRNVAMHIAAMSPLCVQESDVPQEEVEKERAILEAKAKEEGKKPEMIERIVEGQVKKWVKEQALLSQEFVHDDKASVNDVLVKTIATLGENIVIRRFMRFELGEGLQPVARADFAQEVARQLQ